MTIAHIETIPEVLAIAKIVVLATVAFFVTMILSPLWAHILYKYKIGIKIKTNSVDGKRLTYAGKLHAYKSGTPTMGGVLIWGTVILLAWVMSWLAPFLSEYFHKSRDFSCKVSC